ncbi:MAG TPA: YkvA family protein [Ornithinibacter sp.]|nr:YkvA family protein [Ornithinibacter sp.]
MASMKRFAQVGALLKAVRPAMEPGSPGLGERAGSVPRLVRATLNGSYTGVSKGRLALMLAATGYIISPLDLIPEAIVPVLGIADDALVLSWLATRFVEETERFLEWEAAQFGAPYAGGPSAPGGPGSGAGYGSTGSTAAGSSTNGSSPTTGPGPVRPGAQTVRGDVVS